MKDIDGDVLCVSQFTLFANTQKGNKPDFHRAMVTQPHRLRMASCTSHTVFFCRGQKSLKRCTLSSWIAWANFTSPKRSRASQFIHSTNDHVSQRVTTDGKFGAMMNVSLTNEVRDGHRYLGYYGLGNEYSSPQGPVTLTLDSRKFEYIGQSQPVSRKGSAKPSRTTTPTQGPTTIAGPPEV